jgi:protease-4
LLALCCFASACVTVKVNLFEESKPLEEQVVSGSGRDKVLLVNVSGMIMDGSRGLLDILLGGTSPARIKEELDKAAKDDRVKAVVLRISSPGGTVNASDMIHHEILAFKQKRQVPVVACCMGLAASGGYFAATAADVIVAQPTGLVGSIGVVAMKLNVKGLMDKVGVDQDVVKSGPWKDFWSPFKPATPAEKAMMQEIIDDFHRRFVETVVTGRRLARAQVTKVADGRIFTATQARDLGLVDQVGYLDEALALARSRAGLDDAKVVMYRRPDGYRPTIYSLMSDLLADPSPRFLYLWSPEGGL